MGRVRPHHRERILAARHACLAAVDLAGSQVLLGEHARAREIDQADRIIVVVRDQRAAAVGADRDPRRLRLDVRAVARRVAEPDRARLREPGALSPVDMHDVVHPAADDEPARVGQPRDPAIAVGDDQRLLQPRSPAVDPVAEDILP